MNIILILSLFIGLGYIFGKLAGMIKLPTVSGYLIAGLLIAIFALIVPFDYMQYEPVFNYISEITLSFIAFGIGSEFVVSRLRKSGKKIFIITLMEVIGAIGIVSLAMFAMAKLVYPEFTNSQTISFALILGTMSAATAPAATILVIRQFRTKGPVTDTILPVAALDDVLGIVAFGIALPIARILTPMDPNNALQLTFWNIVKGPLIEVLGSIAIGALLGFLLSLVSKKLDPQDEVQVKSIFFILVGLGVSQALSSIGSFSISPLLVNIMVGAMLANLRPHANRSFRVINNFIPVFYILFFTIAGATLDLHVLKTVGMIGVVYVLARAIGKIAGAYTGSVISKAEPNVRKYLGFALLPQGGISIGLSILVNKYLPIEIASKVTTIILFSILIYESTGPIFAKLALQKSDELFKLDLEPTNSELDEFDIN